MQAYNILTVNTREHGSWYYNENRRKCRTGSLSQANVKWREQWFSFASLQVLGKLECNTFRKMATEQTGLINILFLLNLNFIFHYTIYRLTKHWTLFYIIYAQTLTMSINRILGTLRLVFFPSFLSSWLGSFLHCCIFLTFWSRAVEDQLVTVSAFL